MNQAFDGFVKELCSANVNLNEPVFFAKSAVFLEQELTRYLKIEGQHKHSLRFLILSAKKLKNSETDNKFWNALLAFNRLIEGAIESQCTSQKSDHWLRFINIIENLQGYKGSQIFTTTNIKQKRKLRLYFAYMLTWEHIRYIAGYEDDYSPSGDILDAFSPLEEEGEHCHDDAHTHCHDHEH
ncbi:hypothetical protein Ping_1855 [Psychromonas ingrahamii 37]|uniref:Uncharacterized protein n=1 Tax=Psychromonas ingrahamii (strain DSM 17664 / CCUG 51855 / 37) TaxID=357804 RepID=A1SVW7_PSYIN|nr:hypothetical protein [Psychromonas ingrahamii]ABM03632.1 hypothetical protein Ping_1855 [Psychromonas ingrahamii 37]